MSFHESSRSSTRETAMYRIPPYCASSRVFASSYRLPECARQPIVRREGDKYETSFDCSHRCTDIGEHAVGYAAERTDVDGDWAAGDHGSTQSGAADKRVANRDRSDARTSCRHVVDHVRPRRLQRLAYASRPGDHYGERGNHDVLPGGLHGERVHG